MNMASYRAPGVQVKEIDLSEVTVPAGTNVGALVGRTPKGMTNRRVLTTSNKDFVSKFGAPVKGDEYATYTALEFLKASDFLWFTRPATKDDKVGYIKVGSENTWESGKESEGPTKGTLFEVQGYEDGNQPNKYYPAEQISAPLVITALGASDESDNIGIIVVTEDNVETKTIDYTYGYTWEGKYPETDIQGNKVKYYRINVYTKTSEQTVEDAGWTSLDPLKTLVPAESWVVSNNPLAKDYSGNSMYVKDIVNGYSNFVYVNTDNNDITGTLYPIVPLVVFTSSIAAPVEISEKTAPSVKLELTFMATPDCENGVLSLSINQAMIDDTEVTSQLEVDGGNLKVNDQVFELSNGWTAVEDTDDILLTKTIIKSEGTIDSMTWELNAGTLTFTSDDGTEISMTKDGKTYTASYVASELNYTSQNVQQLEKGEYQNGQVSGVVDCWGALYGSKEQVTPNILMAPYVSENGVVTQLVQKVCEIASSRRDCFAVVPADGLNVTNAQTIVDDVGKNLGFARNSYCGIYAGADLMFDQYTNKNIYLPKVAFAGRIIANNDNVAHVWDAPAGLNRGAMNTLDQMKVYTEQEIGYMYANNINTSKRVRGAGDYMWGQKTGQLKASALDRINVRRLLLYIENTLEPSLQAYLFEPNTELLRSRVKSGIDQFLQTIYAGGGLYAYNTVCDSTNNTPYTIDNNELNIDLYVQPVKTVEFINLNIIVTRTGVSFTEA